MKKVRLPDPIRSYVEAFNAGDMEELVRNFTNDARIHGLFGSAPVKTAIYLWQDLHDRMAVQLAPQDAVLDGSRVAVRLTENGLFEDPALAIGGQCSPRAYEIQTVEWFQLENGKISECWACRHSASMFREMHPESFPNFLV